MRSVGSRPGSASYCSRVRDSWRIWIAASVGALACLSASCSGDDAPADDARASEGPIGDGVPFAEALLEPEDMDFEISTGPFRGEPNRPFFVGTVVEGGRTISGSNVDSASPSDAFVAAACRNYGLWLEDVSLDTDVVILNDPELYRSAELLDGDFSYSDAALDAEQLSVEGESAEEVIVSLRESGSSDDDLEVAQSYLEARATPPSSDVLDRYVVYAANQTLRTAFVARMAIEPEAELVEPTASVVRTIDVILGNDTRVEVAEESCLDLSGDGDELEGTVGSGTHIPGASSLDVIGSDVLDGLDDSQRAIAALVVSPHDLGDALRIGQLQVDDPNGNGRIDGRWYPPRVQEADCSIRVDNAPIPTVGAAFVPGDPDTAIDTDQFASLEVLTEAAYTVSVSIQLFDDATQRDEMAATMRAFYDAANDGSSCATGFLGDLTYIDPIETGYPAFALSSDGLLAAGTTGMYSVGDRVLLTVAVAEGRFHPAVENPPQPPDNLMQVVVEAQIVQLEEAGLGAG